jgi:hypothetical protein
MPTQQVVSVSDGPRITVSAMVGQPLYIPTAMRELMSGIFISESLFRNAGANPSGLVGYTVGDPTFLDGDVQDIAEFGEIPVSSGRMGVPQVAIATKKGLGVRISREMRDENNTGAVNRQMVQLRNTFRRADDRTVKALIDSAAVPTMAASSGAWTSGASKPRADITNAIYTIQSAAPAPGDVASPEEWYGFQPDTIVINNATLTTLLNNDDFLKLYTGNAALNNPALASNFTFPETIYGLNVVRSMAWPSNKVLILERGTLGFYSDTRPLEFTALYPEGNGPNGGPRETWRSDATHKRAMAVDSPKAGVWITGV